MFFQDLQFGARQLLRSPGFLIVAVLSLALGIGANSAIFSVLNTILLKKLPVREPDKLVMLTDPGATGMATGKWDGERGLVSYPEFEDFQREGSLFDGLCAVESYSSRLLAHVDGDNEEIWTKLASGSYFSVLGVTPEMGRFFDAGVDKQPGGAPYAVISDSYWDRRFGRSARAVGRTITIAKTVLTIIGVAPREFGSETVGQKPDIWAPLSMQLQLIPGRDLLHPLHDPTEKAMWLHVFGRLKPGVTLSQASVQANVIFKRNLEASYQSVSAARKKEFMNQRLKLHEAATGASDFRESFMQASRILFAAVGIILLICCANVTNLLLARANSRQREIMVRLALGAGKGRIVAQLFTESLLLGLLGAGGGLLLASVAAPLLMRAPASLDEPIAIDPSLDWRVLAFTVAVAIATTIIFGLAPAMRAARMDVNSPLREGSRNATATAGKLRLSKIFVIGQVALSLILLVGTGLLLRSVLNLQKTDLGYSRDKMLEVQVDGAKAGYQGEERMVFYRRIFEKLQAIPGVRGAAFSKHGLFSGGDSSDQIEVEGYTAHGKNDRGSSWDLVGPGYFSVVGIPISLGREINERDQLGGSLICVINEAFRKLFFEGRNPIGKRITDVYGDERVTFEIVGVAANSRDHSLRGEVPPRFFMAAAQHAVGNDIPRAMVFELRTLVQPALVTNAVRHAMAGIDRDAPFEVRSLGEIVSRAVGPDRMVANLIGIFGGLALLLAGLGIYGVMANGVSQRTGEIGIRIAVGAAFNDVVAMVLREAFVMVAIGSAVGLLGAVWVTELIRSQLVGITPTDPLVLASAVGAMVLIALFAAFAPAWRASRVDPIRALRYE